MEGFQILGRWGRFEVENYFCQVPLYKFNDPISDVIFGNFREKAQHPKSKYGGEPISEGSQRYITSCYICMPVYCNNLLNVMYGINEFQQREPCDLTLLPSEKDFGGTKNTGLLSKAGILKESKVSKYRFFANKELIKIFQKD